MKKFIRLLFTYTCIDIELFFKHKKLNTLAIDVFYGASFAQLRVIKDLDLLDDFIKFAAKRGITEGQIYEVLD